MMKIAHDLTASTVEGRAYEALAQTHPDYVGRVVPQQITAGNGYPAIMFAPKTMEDYYIMVVVRQDFAQVRFLSF